MITVHVELEPGFRKGNINNIPLIKNETVSKFFTHFSHVASNKAEQNVDLRVDFVQVRKDSDICEVRALLFPASDSIRDVHFQVQIKVDTKVDEIIESGCEQCEEKESCSHVIALILWLNNKSTQTVSPVVHNFWGYETESLVEEERSEALRVRDIFPCDESRLECDMEATISQEEGLAFRDAILDELESMGLRDMALYQHFRPTVDELEPILVHHTMLNSTNNGVHDPHTFNQHMDDQAKQGLFDKLAMVSQNNYKGNLWLEAQFARLRCSLIHRITQRKNVADSEKILDALFRKERTHSIESRQQLKQHKRFILKQTEKLENKTYSECGLLLHEAYPYICVSPDGITDDHIVEIKAPKTEEEFEKYLENRETIAPKYMAQIQVQMYIANVTKALYCVLSPTFDINGALHYVWVQADLEFVASLLKAAEDFWRVVVFPRLAKIYFNR